MPGRSLPKPLSHFLWQVSGSSGEVLLTAQLCSSESWDKKTALLQTNLDSKAAVITNQWEGTARFMRQTAARAGCRWRPSSCQQGTRMQCKPQGTHWWEPHLHKGLLTSLQWYKASFKEAPKFSTSLFSLFFNTKKVLTALCNWRRDETQLKG